VGSDVRADIVLRHHKIVDHHCTIVAGTYNKGLSGIIHIQNKQPLKFQHKSIIYILDEGEEFVGYTVKFPVVEEESSVTMALRGLNIATPKSVKKRGNHFFAPYTPKRRTVSDSTTMRSVSASQAETVPIRRTASTKVMPSGTDAGRIAAEEAEHRIPWGNLISNTEGKPDIALSNDSTGLGRMRDTVDMYTGERELDFSKIPSLSPDLC
jgi:hypothetical protein